MWVPSLVSTSTKEGPSIGLFMPRPFTGGAAQHERDGRIVIKNIDEN
jgi:hypothetical protein